MVGTDPVRIVAEVMGLLEDGDEYQRMARVINPYGDGQPARRIAEALLIKLILFLLTKAKSIFFLPVP